jgi:hypothetical protein
MGRHGGLNELETVGTQTRWRKGKAEVLGRTADAEGNSADDGKRRWCRGGDRTKEAPGDSGRGCWRRSPVAAPPRLAADMEFYR